MSFLWCPHCKQPHALSTTSCPTTGRRISLGIGRAERALAERGTFIAKRYKVLTLVGDESVGLVYTAKHVNTGRVVLVKVVHNDDDLPLGERVAEVLEMEREARAASLVEHPNVAPVLDFERTGEGEGFLVREHYSATKLSNLLRKSGALEPPDAGDILSQILSGLRAIDLAGIVHRDLASHNVLLQQRGGYRPHVRIAGLGRATGPSIGKTNDGPSGIHYASPELLDSKRGAVDHRSDLFSCGVLLFEMLTGRRPFEAATTDEVRMEILEEEPPSASRLAPRLTSEWLEVLEKALFKDKAKRFQSARDLQRALPSRSRETARLRLFSDTAENAALTDTAPSSDGPRSRTGANIGSRCDPYIGRVIGSGYALETLLGTGTAGAVYKALHTRLRRPVAVKILHDRHRSSQQFVERFKTEALLASKLDHPNVTRVLDCGEESDGRLFLVMEYLEGRSLAAVLAEERQLSQSRAVTIAIQVLSSLVVAHAAGIVHRDMKPENIILLVGKDEEGSATDLAKVCDFGVAKLQHQDVEVDAATDSDDVLEPSELTTSGLLIGSPIYMAPEQVRAETCDVRTDIYGAAVTLFGMLTGRHPHEADTLGDLFKKKLTEPPTRPSTFTDEVDPLLEDIIMRALESAPERRHQTAAEMRTELVEALKLFRPAPASTNTVSIWPEGKEPSSR
jgi:serine/threonine protein kinase